MSSYAAALLLLGQLFDVVSADGLGGCETDRILQMKPRRCHSDWRAYADNVLFCSLLQSSFENGCFGGGEMEEWFAVGDDCCSYRKFGALPLRDGRILLDSQRKRILHSGQKDEKNTGEKHQDIKPVVLAASGMFLLSWSFLCPCLRARRKDVHTIIPKHAIPNSGSLCGSPVYLPSASPPRAPPSPMRFTPLTPQMSRLGSIHFTMDQISRATNNFSPLLKIAEGGSATVYKGQLQDNRTVAIKRAKQEAFDSLEEFNREIELLTNIEHLNLVKLIGFVKDEHERIIVSEYVQNGTLRQHLDGQEGRSLNFAQRLEISIDVAHALTYLHVYSVKPIIHRDVKSSNILLTENLRAKVADFGFAKAGSMNEDESQISTQVKGTAGYLDPEYVRTYKLTSKSDVFSYGILLLEIFSGRRPVDISRPPHERIAVRWAFQLFREGRLKDILDPFLVAPDWEILEGLFGLAFHCAAPVRSDRPSMKKVQEQLWSIRREYHRRLRLV